MTGSGAKARARRLVSAATLAAFALAGRVAAARACSVCFGDPDSPTTRGTQLAIVFLLGVIGSVLATILAVALVWSRRARELERGGDPGAGVAATPTPDGFPAEGGNRATGWSGPAPAGGQTP